MEEEGSSKRILRNQGGGRGGAGRPRGTFVKKGGVKKIYSADNLGIPGSRETPRAGPYYTLGGALGPERASRGTLWGSGGRSYSES